MSTTPKIPGTYTSGCFHRCFTCTTPAHQQGVVLVEVSNNGIDFSEENGDLTYVDPAPGSTKYTFQEEDKVLGRSMTNNPRVNFLDPEVHGGSYKEPAIWIDPAQYTGWMNFMNMVVPDPGGCQDQQVTFLKIEDLMARMKK